MTCAPTASPRAAWTAIDETIRVDGYGFVKKAMAMNGAERGDGICRVADDAGRRGDGAPRARRHGRARARCVAKNLAQLAYEHVRSQKQKSDPPIRSLN